MRSRGERVAELAAGALTGIVFVILYAPLIIGVLFSVVQIRQGKILWETFSVSPYMTLWSNDSVLSALSNTAIVALASVLIASVLAVLLALYTEWEGAIGRRVIELIIYLPFPIAADRHWPCLARLIGSARHQSWICSPSSSVTPSLSWQWRTVSS